MNFLEYLVGYHFTSAFILNACILCFIQLEIGCDGMPNHEFYVSLVMGQGGKNLMSLSEEDASKEIDRSCKKGTQCHHLVKDLSNVSAKNVYDIKNDVWPSSEETTINPIQPEESDQTFVKPTCYVRQGKIVCTLGRFNYVLNVGDLEIPDEVLQNFVALIYRRVQEGDKCFDISIVNPETTECIVEPTTIKIVEETENPGLMPPVTIVCSPYKHKQIHRCGSVKDEEPLETVFKCQWKTTKL
ncbi:hypothetical protein LSTR_LSTR007728 [Laodelphax striatellus]|uniref:Uncharacterized protein n=1 Tax=Laodelphax striatellus TaxID=195883 RepID=A0A482WWK7_LAOST|nr:hypothetical protein LSTR_LSTR007728 [Laodelphax striatellus]